MSKAFESLENEEQETDLEKLKTWFNEQLLVHAPKVKPYDEKMASTSIIGKVKGLLTYFGSSCLIAVQTLSRRRSTKLK